LAWLILPVFAYSNIARIFAFLGFFLILFFDEKKLNIKFFILLLFYIIYTFTINAYFSNDTFVLRHLQLYIFLGCILISIVFYRKHLSTKRQIVYIILVFNLLALVSSLYILKDNSGAARLLAKSSDEAIDLSNSGLGGYGLVYANVLMLPLFIYSYKKTGEKKLKILSGLNIILAVLFIATAQYFIAILLVLIQFIFRYLKNNTFSKRVVFIMLFILLAAFFFININFFDRLTYSWVEFSSLRYKQQDIFNLLNGAEGENNTVGGRTSRYKRSLILFFKNPITGTFSFDNIGKHSNFLDQFAQYGIIIGLILFSLITKLPRYILKKTKDTELKLYTLIFLITLIILGMFNNYGASMGAAFILLSCIEIYEKKYTDQK
jgi:hypothetical protein